MTDRSLHVLIIGASLGGACLAHGLKRAGLGVTVYERKQGTNGGSFGSRVSIGPDGSRALRYALPPDLYETFIATCAEPPRHLTVYSEKLNELFSESLTMASHEGRDSVACLRSASPVTLRQLLLTGIEDVVHFGKEFTRYERRSDGMITAFFADGTSAVGDVLVGADGWQSRVRCQYLPHSEVQDYGLVATTGQVPLYQAASLLPYEKMLSGISVVCNRRGPSFIVQPMEFKWDHQGNLKHNVNGVSAALIAAWPGVLHNTIGDHLAWGFMTSCRVLEPELHADRGNKLIDAVAGAAKRWHPALRALIQLTDPATATVTRVLVSRPLDPWQATGVTLVGNAGYARIPDGAVGVTAALRGAATLCRLLAEAMTKRHPVVAAIHEYETQILRPGFAAGGVYSRCLNRKARAQAKIIGSVLATGTLTRLHAANWVPRWRRHLAGEFGWVQGDAQ